MKKLCILLTSFLYSFCTILKVNSDHFLKQHLAVDFLMETVRYIVACCWPSLQLYPEDGGSKLTLVNFYTTEEFCLHNDRCENLKSFYTTAQGHISKYSNFEKRRVF
jgi:hypothetical protein